MKLSEAILDVLEKHQGEDVSGGTLADLMGVSRTSVWKAVEELRNEGYEIDATTNRGYRLTGAYDRLRDTAIRAHLPELLWSPPTKASVFWRWRVRPTEPSESPMRKVPAAGETAAPFIRRSEPESICRC